MARPWVFASGFGAGPRKTQSHKIAMREASQVAACVAASPVGRTVEVAAGVREGGRVRVPGRARRRRAFPAKPEHGRDTVLRF